MMSALAVIHHHALRPWERKLASEGKKSYPMPLLKSEGRNQQGESKKQGSARLLCSESRVS